MSSAGKLAWIGIALGVAIVALVLLVASVLGYIGGGRTVTPNGNFSVAEARSYSGFPVFYPGESINGHPLTAVARESLGPMRKGQESVLFLYGDCKIGPGIDPGGCSLPVSVSNEPACSRNLAMYSGSFPARRRLRVRGTEAGAFEGGSHLEIQTGATTVVIFAFSRSEAFAVARHLRGVNVPVAEGDRLPPPAPGAIDGTIPCPR